MSNFNCEFCGTAICDTPKGYVTGCPHYPLNQHGPSQDEEKRMLESTMTRTMRNLETFTEETGRGS